MELHILVLCFHLKSQHRIRKCPWVQWKYNCNLYCCSLHNTVHYPLSTALSLTPPTKFPSPRSVCHILHSLSVCYDPYTTAKIPAADSHTVAGYLTDTVRKVLAMLSVCLYLHSSVCCRSGQATPVHWLLQMFQLTLNWHCSMIYQDVTKSVNWWNYGQLVFEGLDWNLNITLGDLVTIRTYLDGDSALRWIANLYILS